ncbi:hypothetical protein DWX43_17130 [Clostridium sp. AF19-22AC]|jgi:DNA-directed RNA polymerase alpha subunit|uniref:DNA-directed RNA polymerase subunit alpha C-terminal domain-containing protein n=1 Tax=Clostridia TaxID=186801 RepID=UPI000E4E5643|nr:MULTISPECIES: DNA-directed RNA polymerase subunit alpha C-terminal domain-containing protein [Clostridia]RHR25847.1 hypothetical protein DWX43_17130 [Clostridium sp. AF19-22AC]
MDGKVEAYLLEADRKQISQKEKEEYIRILGIFEEIGLMNEEEQKYWIKKISGDLFQGIETLNLSSRSYHALIRAGVGNYGQLRNWILKRGILNVRNIGTGTAAEVLGKAIHAGLIKEEEITHLSENRVWKRVLTDLKGILNHKKETELIPVSESSRRMDME